MSISLVGQQSMRSALSMEGVSQGETAMASGDGLTTRQAFQDFVAGTFFKQMLKSLRSTQGEVHYLNGGQAEEMFRTQLDQEMAEQLAHEHGAPFVGSRFERFTQEQAALQQSAAGQQARADEHTAGATAGEQLHYLA